MVYGNKIVGIRTGESFFLQRTYLSVPSDRTVSSVQLIVKGTASVANNAALFSSSITTATSVYGQIFDNGAATGVARFQVNVPIASTHSYVVMDPGVLNTQILWTAVKFGFAQNQISLQYVVAGNNTPLSVSITAYAIVVNLQTNNVGAPISTAAQVITLVNSDLIAGALVQGVNATGSTGAGIVVAVAPTFLAFGEMGTTDFIANGSYYYEIILNISDGSQVEFENGTISTVAFNSQVSKVTTISQAGASQTNSPRFDNIINSYVDSALDVFRQLRVWDMHARRSGNDEYNLVTPYRNWNTSFVPEVYDSNDMLIPPNLVTVDYANGSFRVDGDPGYEDYFVTFRFDYFGVPTLQAFLNWTLQELNVAGAANRYVTNYSTVDAAPENWDGPLTFGVLAKAFQKLSTDSGLWNTFLIWTDGQAGQTLARETAQSYNETLNELKQGLKWGRFLARPTSQFYLFETVGFGFFMYAGSKFRELELNKMGAM